MRLSYNWLKTYVDLEGVSVDELVNALTFAGLEVEAVDQMASGSNLIIGEILEVKDHPDSDRLHVCKVDIGKEVLQIVCGAANVAVGKKVIVAQVGAKLPEIEIKESTIRGIESRGMICSLSELGVDKKNLTEKQLSGIEELSEAALVGDENPLALLGLDDISIEVSLTPNRNDCLAMWSMAKEVGAILNRKVDLPKVDGKSSIGTKTNLRIHSETEKCPVFVGKKIGKLVIKDSPAWMKKALMANGVKVINNVVDISNYVMLETGQPLHFYDVAKLPAEEITVKDQLIGEYEALDGIVYPIEPEDIMITSGGKNIGIAGIMGGEDSKIDELTQAIIIEAAIFDRVAIRKTSRRLNLQTEASLHFQKGIEPLAPLKAMDRAVALLIELAEAEFIEETVIYGDIEHKPTTIETRVDFHNRVLGTNFTENQIVEVFRRLDFNPEIEGEVITVTIPSYRTDIHIDVDLTEEIIRLMGFEHIQSTLPVMESTMGSLAPNEGKRKKIKEILVGTGFNEVMTYSLVSEAYLKNAVMPIGTPVTLANPMSEDRKYYRPSLLPALLDVISYNQARSLDDWSFFELASVYDNEGNQEERLSLAMSHKTVLSRWQKLTSIRDFFIMKGQLINILKKMGFDEQRIFIKSNEINTTVFHPNQSAAIYIDRNLFGVFGKVHPKIQEEYDIDTCIIAELNLSTLYQSKPAAVKYKPISKYPAVYLDIAILVDDSVIAGEIVSAIRKVGGKLVQGVEIFDVYKGNNIPEDKKSLAIRVLYQSFEKTLTDADVQPIHDDIIKTLQRNFAAIYRDK